MDVSALATSLISGLWDYLSFRKFITPALLLWLYYAGTIGIVILIIYALERTRQRVTAGLDAVAAQLDPQDQGHVAELGELVQALPLWERLLRTRLRMILAALLAIVLFQLCWRMLFEFLLAYFQMHDALQQMTERS
jgi:TRAP-type C4-dicarboxylate transport system permease small subunit